MEVKCVVPGERGIVAGSATEWYISDTSKLHNTEEFSTSKWSGGGMVNAKIGKLGNSVNRSYLNSRQYRFKSCPDYKLSP